MAKYSRPVGGLLFRLLQGAVVMVLAGILVLAPFPGNMGMSARGSESARDNARGNGSDRIGELIRASKQNSGQRANNAKPATSSRSAGNTVKRIGMRLALPTRNPLRGSRNSPSPRHNFTSTILPPSPTRSGGISNSIKALAPLLGLKISRSDIKALKQSIDAVLKIRAGEARAAMSRITDPAARKLARWYYLRKLSDLPDPLSMMRFAKRNPDWPSGRLLQRRTELALLKANASPQTVLAMYRKKPPSSATGKLLLALAYRQKGQAARALKLARTVWHSHALGEKLEKKLLAAFGKKLTTADHRRRADHFLYKDKRRHLAAVRRVRKFLPKAEQEKINLRMEVIKRRLADASRQYEKLGPKALTDSGLLFNKIQLLRRKKEYDRSRSLLHKAPTSARAMVEPDEWWIERRLQVRYALRHNKPDEAYKIASRHGEVSRKNRCDAAFLSGWIALTRLDKPQLAEKHFLAQRQHARSRPEIAKAEYWLGRVRLRQRDSIGALAHFAAAARYFRTFYGQLALQSVEQGGHIGTMGVPVPSRRDLKRFMARDAVRALLIAHQAQLGNLVPLFFNHLAWRLKSPGEMTLLAELASQIHSRRGSVITGKIGVYRGFKLDRYAYPVNALPHFKQLTSRNVDTALVLALARQESEFNPLAKSPVGARGLMQIMPGTAKIIARQHKVRYSRSRLTSDPAYNIALGVAHLHDLIEKYNGSYILPLVAYNAGPGRVRDWIEAFGDPRDPAVDTIDWIESIPFSETRRYVQRIMSSVQIFRARMSGQKGRIRLLEDINRGYPDPAENSPSPPVVKINYQAD